MIVFWLSISLNTARFLYGSQIPYWSTVHNPLPQLLRSPKRQLHVPRISDVDLFNSVFQVGPFKIHSVNLVFQAWTLDPNCKPDGICFFFTGVLRFPCLFENYIIREPFEIQFLAILEYHLQDNLFWKRHLIFLIRVFPFLLGTH